MVRLSMEFLSWLVKREVSYFFFGFVGRKDDEREWVWGDEIGLKER